MPTHKLENYLHTYRKSSGLSQEDVAFLVGCGSSVYQHERRRREPSLRAAIAYEAVYGVPVSELFAGMREAIGRDIEKRRLELRSKLQGKEAQGKEARMVTKKLRWLSDPKVPQPPAHESRS